MLHWFLWENYGNILSILIHVLSNFPLNVPSEGSYLIFLVLTFQILHIRILFFNSQSRIYFWVSLTVFKNLRRFVYFHLFLITEILCFFIGTFAYLVSFESFKYFETIWCKILQDTFHSLFSNNFSRFFRFRNIFVYLTLLKLREFDKYFEFLVYWHDFNW